MPNPIPGKLSDKFAMRFLGLDEPTVEPGIAVDSDSKSKDYVYQDPDLPEGKWLVLFCYLVGSKGASAFTQSIIKSSGPGPATLSGMFSPAVPATTFEEPPMSGNTFDATTRPLRVYDAVLSGDLPNRPNNLASLSGDAQISIYDGTIGIVSN